MTTKIQKRRKRRPRTQEQDERTVRMMKATLDGSLARAQLKLNDYYWWQVLPKIFDIIGDQKVLFFVSTGWNSDHPLYCVHAWKVSESAVHYQGGSSNQRSASRKLKKAFRDLCLTPAS